MDVEKQEVLTKAKELNDHKDEDDQLFDAELFQHTESGRGCDGAVNEQCSTLKRMSAVMSHHHRLMKRNAYNVALARRLFTEFCDQVYAKRLSLGDYILYVDVHSDDASRAAFASMLRFECPSLAQCGWTARHVRDRAEMQRDGDYNAFCRRFDALHFNILHLEQVGLRVAVAAEVEAKAQDDDDEAEEDLVDEAMLYMAQQIEAKKKDFAVERVDNATNSKFNIVAEDVAEAPVQHDGQGLYVLSLPHRSTM